MKLSLNFDLIIKVLLLFSIGVSSLAGGEISEIVLKAISDAYIQVSVFVAASLYLLYYLEHVFSFDIGSFMLHSGSLQPFVASFLGALPGCGGAIIVVTNYTKENISFGSVVACLIATMGDAAFLLIAKQPSVALWLISVSFLVGSLSGLIIDSFHPAKKQKSSLPTASLSNSTSRNNEYEDSFAVYRRAWFCILVPGTILGILSAIQLDLEYINRFLDIDITLTLGVIGGSLSIFIWCYCDSPIRSSCVCSDKKLAVYEKTIQETVYITSWVAFAYMLFGFQEYFFGSLIESWLLKWKAYTPLIAVLVGLIPGCGPQILTTSLYLAGAIPLSAQLGNAISNDGDALFPAIALAPKAAIYASLYSTIPAIISAYCYYYLFE